MTDGPVTLLLTPEEAADYAGIPRSRLYLLVMGGRIGSIKLGRRRYIPRSAVDSFVEEELGRQTGDPPQ